MNDPISEMLLRTHSAWASNLLTDLPKFDESIYKYALANSSEGFVDIYIQSFGDMLQKAHIERPFDDDEFLVTGHEEHFVLTSKCLYIVNNENNTVDAFLLCDIANYQTSGLLTKKICVELNDGRKVEYSSMDAIPVRTLIDELITRKLSWSNTDEPALKIELPNLLAAKMESIRNHISNPAFCALTMILLAWIFNPPVMKYIFIGLFVICFLWLLWGIDLTRRVFAYRMVLSDEGIEDGDVKYKWEEIEFARFFEEVSDKDQAGMSLHTHTGNEIRVIIPDKEGLPYSTKMVIEKHVKNIERIPKG